MTDLHSEVAGKKPEIFTPDQLRAMTAKGDPYAFQDQLEKALDRLRGVIASKELNNERSTKMINHLINRIEDWGRGLK